jgi:hypothetical protein
MQPLVLEHNGYSASLDGITFDHDLDARIAAAVADEGTDARLLRDATGAIAHATMAEKILLLLAVKLANLVPEGGIWMNTQRPEWNDANNALVGNGLSMVTMAQLRRHLVFLAELFERRAEAEAEVSEAVRTWFSQTRRTFEKHVELLARPTVTDGQRRTLLDELQAAFERYRDRLHGAGLGASASVEVGEAAALCRTALRFVEHSLRANRRPDGLYHSYNLLALTDGAAKVEPLYEMLEGQVAILSSGLLTPKESLEVIDALFASKLFRADQESFLLYPERTLPGFLEKNRPTSAEVASSPLLQELVERGDHRLGISGIAHADQQHQAGPTHHTQREDPRHVQPPGLIAPALLRFRPRVGTPREQSGQRQRHRSAGDALHHRFAAHHASDPRRCHGLQGHAEPDHDRARISAA